MTDLEPAFDLPEEMIERARKPLRVVCPAARPGKFVDSGNEYVRCEIEDQVLPLSTAAVAVLTYCTADYETCPTWQLARDDPNKIVEIEAKKEQRRQDRLTKEQIRKGIRVDDREEDDRMIDDASS